MAKDSIRDFSATAGSNTDIQSVNIDENCPASGINNAIRELMVDLKNVSTGAVNLETPTADSLTVAGDLTVDTNTLKVDSSNNRVGIGTTAGDAGASLTINKSPVAAHGNPLVQIGGSTFTSGGYYTVGLGFTNSTYTEPPAEIAYVSKSDSGGTKGDIVFGTRDATTNTAVSTRMTIDSSGNVGIGTSSPVSQMTLGGTSDLVFTQNGYGIAWGGNNGSPRIFGTSGGALTFKHGGGSTAMTLDSNGHTLFGQSSTDSPGVGNTTAGAAIRGTGISFFSASGSAPGRFNRSGDDGEVIGIAKDGTTVGSIGNRGTNLFVSFRPESVGDGCGLSGSGSSAGAIIPTDGDGIANDNHIDLGGGSSRFDDIFATNGTIQTSDQNEKQDIASLTTAEMTAAKAISKLFKTFKWKDKVAAKGDAARTHTGVIAQEVQTAMSDAGLDASKYAFWCSDTWWETSTEVAAVEADEEAGIEAKDAYTRIDTYQTADEAPEGATQRTRLGVRYPELLAFIGAATEQRLADIETRLTALEA